MKFRVADRSLSVKIITSIVIVVCIILFIYSNQDTFILIVASFLAVLIIGAYLLAPSSYQIKDNNLIIWKNFGRKNFPNIKECTGISKRVGFTIRLLGNGGVFAGTGIFWNRKYGIFRAYVTTGKLENMVCLNTDRGKVIISPVNPEAFVEYCEKFKK